MVFRYVRQMTNARREKIRKRLAMMYAIISWNGFAICLYYIVKRNRLDSNLPQGLYEAALSENIENTKVIRFDGLSFVEEINYGKEEIEAAREKVRNVSKLDVTEDF